jgi:hypothetical protein
MQAAQQGLLTEASPPLNSFDPAVFQQAAQIAQQNLAMQEQAKQAESQRQMQMQQMQMQERQNNARGTLDHQRASADDRNRQRQLQLQDRESQQRFGLAKLQESKRFSDQQRFDAEWQQESAQILDKDIAEVMKAARAIEYTPEGKRLYAGLSGYAKALQGSRAKLRPAQYAQLAGQFLETFAEADLASYQVEPPSMKEIYAQNVMDMGNGMVAHTDKIKVTKGTNLKDMASVADLEKDADGNTVIATPEERAIKGLAGEKNVAAFSKAYKEAEAALQAEWSARPENAAVMTPPRMDPKEVQAKMLETYRLQADFERMLSGGTEPGAETAPTSGMTPAGATQGPGADFRARIRAENKNRSNREKPIPWYFRESEEGRAASQAMRNAQTPEEAAQVTQQFIQAGVERVASMPEAAKVQERMAMRGIEGAWTQYITEQAVANQIEAGSKDPFSDVLKHAEAMLSLPDGFDLKDAPLEWQERMEKEMATVHLQAEYDMLPPGEIFLDGVTGKIVRKPLKGATAGSVNWQKGIMDGVR